MEIGIVGLPNVGKSTLFNALTAGHAACSNYPFTTIEPNVGVVSVPDKRLERVAAIYKSAKAVPATIRFVDIAGLVKGASQGQGLGNQFLSHVREVDAIVHLVRAFSSGDVVHVMGEVDIKRDIEIVSTELILADLQTMEKQFEKAQGQAKTGEKAAREKLELVEAIRRTLNDGKPARTMGLDRTATASYMLLTDKPVLYVVNADEDKNKQSQAEAVLADIAKQEQAGFLVLCGQIEAEIVQLSPQDREEFLKEMGLEKSGLERVIEAAYKLLNLAAFFTANPNEAHAWAVAKGTSAPVAAGKIHSDMETGFIRADVCRFDDLDKLGSDSAAREKGLLRSEGKTYLIQDGDVAYFHFQKPR
ncbi:MAG: redox-regulated ATPase YchF [Elusimicrobia bacterium]|nr:redox-regulated ATPase YchF [Elusimicrobiota bacterium]